MPNVAQFHRCFPRLDINSDSCCCLCIGAGRPDSRAGGFHSESSEIIFKGGS